MSTATAFAALKSALLAVHGRTAELDSGSWRKSNLTVCLLPGWRSAESGGIAIDRIEPIALVSTDDIDAYDFSNGWKLEIGSYDDAGNWLPIETYRVLAKAGDEMGMTTLTLAKE